MDSVSEQNAPIFARLDRPKGRPVREKLASARVTADELKELDTAAAAGGKLFGEWAREVLLREARMPRADALFTEIVATRMLLNLVLKPLACGERMSAEQFSAVLANVRTNKRKSATDVLEQYAVTEQKEG